MYWTACEFAHVVNHGSFLCLKPAEFFNCLLYKKQEGMLIYAMQIARCEITKIIPQFLREFDIETASEWKCLERWFNKPQNVRVRVTRRKKC